MTRRSCQASLLTLLSEADGLISGEELCNRLGVSRTAVWKQIRTLREQGYRIESVPSRGYRLVAAPDRLTVEGIERQLDVVVIGRRLEVFAQLDSTNNRAYSAAEAGAPEGTVILADQQTSGRGRLGRRWESPAASNFYGSVILRPDVPPSQAPQLTFLSAVAVVEAIEALTPLKPSIKWPNDVLVGRYKVAGLLNEMSAETDRVSFVILGIGVNLNMRSDQFPEDLRSPASSLALLGGSPIDREQFAARVLSALDRQYQRFLREGFDPIRQEWSRLCTAAGKTVRVLSGDRLIEGGFAGVDHDGALLVATISGIERLISGDVTVC